jgi:hypothetical protein
MVLGEKIQKKKLDINLCSALQEAFFESGTPKNCLFSICFTYQKVRHTRAFWG